MRTAGEIERLIQSPKALAGPPPLSTEKDALGRRIELGLLAASGEEFVLFVQQVQEPEECTIGLDFLAPDAERVTLMRFSGQHRHPDGLSRSHLPQFKFRVYRAAAGGPNHGLFGRHRAHQVEFQASFEEALTSFCQSVNVSDWAQATAAIIKLVTRGPERGQAPDADLGQ